jgi:3',5'-cyclic-AMP phosphodiesterase
MKRIAWLTDIHLNFLPDRVGEFAEQIAQHNPSALLISGDIGEADSTAAYLQILAALLQRPIYFVLGNHDFYGGSIKGMRGIVSKLARESRWLHWLTQEGVIELAPGIGLIGHDGWADSRYGDFARSNVMMNDYLLIHELTRLSKPALMHKLESLGDEAAAHFRVWLPAALSQYPHVIAVTHVPPFSEAAIYNGQISDDNYLPHFASKAVGDVMLDVMRANPERHLTVVCGHTHGEVHVKVLDNLEVWAGGAEYGAPKIQRFFEIP